MNNKQVQKAGENSNQFQAQTIVVNSGIQEKRAREIFMEMFDVARRDLTQEAKEIAAERIGRFENDLIPKIEKVEGAINAFADPDFQFALTSAHKTAASTNRESDYALLSELLIHRTQKKSSKVTCAGIGRAIEIVDDISDESLIGLTVAYAVQQYIPVSGNISEGLATLNALYEKMSLCDLPKGFEWLDHLDVLDAVRMSTIATLKRYEHYIKERIPGYFVCGIEKDSQDYQQVIEKLREANLPTKILCNHELNDGFARLNVTSKQHIDDICLIHTINKGGQEIHVQQALTKEQKEILMNIYDMSSRNTNLEKKIEEKFVKKICEYSSIKKVSDWWNDIICSFQITSVGQALAYANAKRIDSTLPDMS